MIEYVLIGLIIAGALIGGSMLMSSESGNGAIGYEYLDNGSILHFWNLHDDYYINVSSGIQLTNHYQEWWTHNYFCGGLKLQSGWEYYCTDILPFTWGISTDNSTYFNYTGYRDVTKILGGKTYTVRFAVRYHLKADDTYLSVQPYAKNIGNINIPLDTGFAWHIRDIQIANDTENDWAYINNTQYWLNESISVVFTNLSDVEVFLHDANGEWLWLNWSGRLNYKYAIKSEGGQYNAPNTLFINAGKLDTGQEKSTTFGWIDALCNWNCVHDAPSGQQDLEVGDTYTHTAKITFSGTCSTSHTLEAQYNDSATSSGYIKITQNTNISTTSTNPQSGLLCRFGTCGPYSWILKAEEDNQDEGMYKTRTKCSFNGGEIKYATGNDVNITTPPPAACNYVELSSSLTLTADNSSCFNITADDITLDCDNYMLFATEQLNDYAVIAEGRDNITVKNCYMKNWSLAIKLSNTPNSLIDNMTIYNTTDFSSEDVSAVGIYINASDNMTITNINITKMETDSSSTSACYHASVIRGIYIDSSSNITITNATFDDINGTYTGDTSPEEGCQSGEVQTGETIRFWNSGNITITNVNINDSYYGIYSHTSSSDSYVYDSKISLIEYKDVRLYYATLYLYNTTFNDSQTLLAGTAKLYVYQYLRANITDSSFSPIDSADVNFTDAFNTVTQNTTDANGLTDWVLLQSFNETSTLITYFTPYNISAWKSGYNLNWTTTNLNESHTVLVMLSSAAVSTCIYGDSGNWEIDCTENCTIENNYDLNGNNITATGLGNITVSANLTNVDMFIKDNNCLIIKGVGYEIS